MTGTLVGVGLGPGDPDLMTVRAADLLAEADVVFVAVADSGDTGRAEQAVLRYVEAWRVERVVVAPHGPDHPQRRERAWSAAAAGVAGWFDDHPDGVAVFAAPGGPGFHPLFGRLAVTVRGLVDDLRVERVPGFPTCRTWPRTRRRDGSTT